MAISTVHLKALLRREEINGYYLVPHFLVKIMNIAHADQKIKEYLDKQGFYADTINSAYRLKIVHDPNFFSLLAPEQKQALLPFEYTNITGIMQKDQAQITLEDIYIIISESKQFKNIENYLKDNNFYTLSQNPSAADNEAHLKGIISDPAFRKVVMSNSTELARYQQYVQSSTVKEETSTGACINIVKIDPGHPLPLEAKQDGHLGAQQEGHWKLHIGIEMRAGTQGNTQSKIDAAYNIILKAMQKHNMIELKVVAPFSNVESMRGKEITAYLKEQQIVIAAGPDSNVVAFISEVELQFRALNIQPQGRREDANKAIASSPYFSYRNERARVFSVPESTEGFFIPPEYHTGNVIIIYKGKAHFMENGSLNDDLLKVSKFQQIVGLPAMEDDYLSAAAAANIADIFWGDRKLGYNPFHDSDEKFKLGKITSSQMIRYWVDWLSKENNAYLDTLKKEVIDNLVSQDQVELVETLSIFSLDDHHNLAEMLSSTQFNDDMRYQPLKRAAKTAERTKDIIDWLVSLEQGKLASRWRLIQGLPSTNSGGISGISPF